MRKVCIRRKRLVPALAALSLLAAACGGGSGSEATPGASATTGPDETPTTAVTAADLLPDLSSAGLVRQPIQTIPGPTGYSIVAAVYAGSGVSVRIEVRTYPNLDAALQDYPNQVAGWKAPPAGVVFSSDPKNVDSEPLSGFDAAAAYVSSRADSSGKQVWTDILRADAFVVVMHTLSGNPTLAASARSQAAEALLASLP